MSFVIIMVKGKNIVMENKELRLSKVFCFSGIVGMIFYVLHDIVGGMNYPGYQWMSQAVSDLTATDAPSYTVASGFSNVYGIMSIVCCLFVCVLAQQKTMTTRIGISLFTVMQGISAVGYSLFPLSSAGYDGSTQSFVHVYIITIAVVVLSIVSLILIAIGSKRDNKRILSIISIIALALMFFGAVGSGIITKEYFGIVERFSTYSVVCYTTILGIFFGIEK